MARCKRCVVKRRRKEEGKRRRKEEGKRRRKEEEKIGDQIAKKKKKSVRIFFLCAVVFFFDQSEICYLEKSTLHLLFFHARFFR